MQSDFRINQIESDPLLNQPQTQPKSEPQHPSQIPTRIFFATLGLFSLGGVGYFIADSITPKSISAYVGITMSGLSTLGMIVALWKTTQKQCLHSDHGNKPPVALPQVIGNHVSDLRLNQEIKTLKAELEVLKGKIKLLEDVIRDKDESLKSLDVNYRLLQDELQALEDEKANLEEEIDTLDLINNQNEKLMETQKAQIEKLQKSLKKMEADFPSEDSKSYISEAESILEELSRTNQSFAPSPIKAKRRTSKSVSLQSP